MAWRKVEVQLWADAKFRSLSRDGQLLMLHLLTCPDPLRLPGVFAVGALGLADELGWPVDDIRRAADELNRAGVLRFDWSARLVWLVNALKHNPPASSLNVKGWSATWELVPECPLKLEIWRNLEAVTLKLGSQWITAFRESFRMPHPKGHAMPHADPLPMPHPKGHAMPLPKQQDQDQDQDLDQRSAGNSPATAPVDDLELFSTEPKPAPPKKRGRKPKSPEADLLAKMQDHRLARLTGDDGPQPLPDATWSTREHSKLTPLLDCRKDLLISALDLYLEADYPLRLDPPCPLRLFVKQWPEWVSRAQKADAHG